MQNKGAIKFFAIAFAIVCAYQLSFTLVTNIVERKAANYAKNEQYLYAQFRQQSVKKNNDSIIYFTGIDSFVYKLNFVKWDYGKKKKSAAISLALPTMVITRLFTGTYLLAMACTLAGVTALSLVR